MNNKNSRTFSVAYSYAQAVARCFAASNMHVSIELLKLLIINDRERYSFSMICMQMMQSYIVVTQIYML